jgi:hypothetical protein
MGIRFTCPNGHKLHVKEFLAGKRAVCPDCGARLVVPNPQSAAAVGAESPGSPLPADFGSASVVIPTFDPVKFVPQGADGPAAPFGSMAGRRRSRQPMQSMIAIALFVVAVLLVVVLVLVLSREGSPETEKTPEPANAATRGEHTDILIAANVWSAHAFQEAGHRE